MKNLARRCIQRARRFWHEHPVFRQVLIWTIPALIFGAVLRLMLLSYSPYAYWGSDSRSYYGFTTGLMTTFDFSLNEKRRYLYPPFLLFVSLLPGTPLKWLAWIQAALGLITLLPLGYLVRKLFVTWRWFIIPVTILYAGMPVMLWYEHELLAETIFFAAILWSFAGWVAWTSQPDPARARQLWWCFLIPFAIFLLLKPSGRFFWPGICLGLVVVGSWRILKWREWLGAGLVLLASLTVGSSGQGAWLLYTTVFPLTQLDTPLHADLKAEIREMVIESRSRIDAYGDEDEEEFSFIRSPQHQEQRPLWKKLAKDEKALSKVYKELAIEAIKAHPDLFIYIALQRLGGSMNLADFEPKRFEADYFAKRFEANYRDRRTSEDMLRTALAIPPTSEMPPYEEIHARLCPKPGSSAAAFLVKYANWYQQPALVHRRTAESAAGTPAFVLTPLCWWVIAGALLSLTAPWRKTSGIWTITLAVNLVAVFLVGVQHHRYFAPAWPFILLLLPLPVDAVVRGVCWWRGRRGISNQ